MTNPVGSNKHGNAGKRGRRFDEIEALLPPVIQPSVPYSVYLADYEKYLAMRKSLLQDKWRAQAAARRGETAVPEFVRVRGPDVVKASKDAKPMYFGTIEVGPSDSKFVLETRKKVKLAPPKVPAGVVHTRDGRFLAGVTLLNDTFGYVGNENRLDPAWLAKYGENRPLGSDVWPPEAWSQDTLFEADKIAAGIGEKYLAEVRRVAEHNSAVEAAEPLKTEKAKAKKSEKRAAPAEVSPAEAEAAKLKKLATRRAARRRQRKARKSRALAARTQETKAKAALAASTLKLVTTEERLAKASRKGKPSGSKVPKTALPAKEQEPAGMAASKAKESPSRLKRREKRVHLQHAEHLQKVQTRMPPLTTPQGGSAA